MQRKDEVIWKKLKKCSLLSGREFSPHVISALAPFGHETSHSVKIASLPPLRHNILIFARPSEGHRLVLLSVHSLRRIVIVVTLPIKPVRPLVRVHDIIVSRIKYLGDSVFCNTFALDRYQQFHDVRDRFIYPLGSELYLVGSSLFQRLSRADRIQLADEA